MKRSQSKFSRAPIYTFIILLSALLYVSYQYFLPHPQANGVFAVTTPMVSLTYGVSTVNGTMTKTTSAAKNSQYILILPDTRPILLNAQGLDNLVGRQVSVSGILTPKIDDMTPMTMFVNTITVTK
jgi:hypothetical protein